MEAEKITKTGFATSISHATHKMDLNNHLITHPESTFFFRMKGDAMAEEGIHHGDIMVVDRSVPLINNKIIVAVIDNEMLVRRYKSSNKLIQLTAPKQNPVIINDASQMQYWGSVTYVIHKL